MTASADTMELDGPRGVDSPREDRRRGNGETRELEAAFGDELGAEFARFVCHVTERRGAEPLSLRTWLELAEIWRITSALREAGGNRSAAARALGIGRRTLYTKMDRLGIAPTWSV